MKASVTHGLKKAKRKKRLEGHEAFEFRKGFSLELNSGSVPSQPLAPLGPILGC